MQTEVLIVGAGPVGLAAALFARREGYSVRIVDRRMSPAQQSKALAVNPRTLAILESTGVTEEMLKRGRKIPGGMLWHENGQLAAEVSFEKLPGQRHFMLALSQAVTESLLTETLKKLGVEIERGREAVGVVNSPGSAQVRFADGEEIDARVVLAADGSHSALRTTLGIDFEGRTLDTEWYLVDVPFKTDLAADRAHVVFLDGPGFYFLLPVIHDEREKKSGDPIWRVLGSHPDFLNSFKRGKPTGQPLWESKFRVPHKICHHLRQGSVYLAGDAAHVHSPVGARGMNLGIEDAYVFAKLLKENRLHEYDEERHAVDAKVVNKVEWISRIAVGKSIFARSLRAHLLPRLLQTEFVAGAMSRAMSGMDHGVAEL